MKTSILALFAMLALSQGSFAASESDSWFQSVVGRANLACSFSKVADNQELILFVQDGRTAVRALRSDNGQVFTVDHSSIANGQLKITLTNDIDGPLSQDLVVLAQTDVQELVNGLQKEIKGLEVYSEGYDGTTQRFAMTCVLK